MSRAGTCLVGRSYTHSCLTASPTCGPVIRRERLQDVLINTDERQVKIHGDGVHVGYVCHSIEEKKSKQMSEEG